MQTNRRDFLARGAVVAGATLSFSPFSVLAEHSASNAVFSLSAEDRAVLAFIAKYGATRYFTGGGVLGRVNRSSHKAISLLVRVDDLDALAGALAASPFNNIFGENDLLSFSVSGALYTLENLPSAEYNDRLASFQRPSGSLFAHDAVRYDISREAILDPRGAMSGGEFLLRRTSQASGFAAEVAQLIRGLVDAARYGLSLSAEFLAFQHQTLNTQAESPDDAEAVSAMILGAVAPLGGKGQASVLAALATSPLADSALATTAKISVSAVERRYKNLQSTAAREVISNGGLWLAALLGPKWAQSGSRPSIKGSDRYSDLQTRAALAEARRFLQSSASAGINQI